MAQEVYRSGMSSGQYADPGASDPGGWYLRGDVGATMQKIDRLHNVDYELRLAPVAQTAIFDASALVGGGIGYQFNSWLRADVTGQYRANANFKGSDRFVYGLGGGVQGAAIDTYIASVSSYVLMANVYADLGTWYNITPFVGAGIGASRNTVKGLIDNSLADVSPGVVGPGVAYADPASKWNMAWALHAGLAYKIDPSLTLELGYHYMNLGDALSGDSVTFQGANTLYNPMEFKSLTSHDVTIGLRWNLDPGPVYMAPPPPLVRKG
ncbi:MAG: outer membrane beta-barrel protein [Tardiphaga sp.]